MRVCINEGQHDNEDIAIETVEIYVQYIANTQDTVYSHIDALHTTHPLILMEPLCCSYSIDARVALVGDTST